VLESQLGVVQLPVLTKQPSVVVQYIQNLLKADVNIQTLGVRDVFYGDQIKVPRTPAIAVESGITTRVPYEASLRTQNRFPVYILCYYGKIQDIQANRLQSDQLAEAVDVALTTDPRLGGLIVFGYIAAIDPGIAVRSGAMLRATRITFDCMNVTSL
jgi:hypothetical protein